MQIVCQYFFVLLLFISTLYIFLLYILISNMNISIRYFMIYDSPFELRFLRFFVIDPGIPSFAGDLTRDSAGNQRKRALIALNCPGQAPFQGLLCGSLLGHLECDREGMRFS